MPELPEVNRVCNILRNIGLGRTISSVTTTEDTIVYCDGNSNLEFEKAIKGRTINSVGRYGKVFYLMLDGKGKHPVMHLGMTGNVYVRGTDPAFYKSAPKKVDTSWPPRYMKFILTLAATESKPGSEVVFTDPRRLARIRLCQDPLNEPPISKLGFDPILNMPTKDHFAAQLRKKGCTIKSLLLDQAFSAGVGNWVADEVLFHARIHPEQKPNVLTEDQIMAVYEKIKYVCNTAVAVDADASQFPEGWLFKHRWGKGKKQDSDLILTSGEKASIKWITVGSRTSAFVPKIQILHKQIKTEKNDKVSERSSVLSEPPDLIIENETPDPPMTLTPNPSSRKRKRISISPERKLTKTMTSTTSDEVDNTRKNKRRTAAL